MYEKISNNEAAKSAFKALTGKDLDKENVYTLIYKQGKEGKVEQQLNADKPDATIAGLKAAKVMLEALRNDTKARDAFESLNGVTLPVDGALNDAQLDALYSLIYQANGSKQTNWNNTTETIKGLETAINLLTELRKRPNSLVNLEKITGILIPREGPLNFTKQVEILFTQLYDKDGNGTLAWRDPAKAAKILAEAKVENVTYQGNKNAKFVEMKIDSNIVRQVMADGETRALLYPMPIHELSSTSPMAAADTSWLPICWGKRPVLFPVVPCWLIIS